MKVSKFNSAFYGVLFVMIPYQLIGLQNFSLFTKHINQASLYNYTPISVVRLQLTIHVSSNLLINILLPSMIWLYVFGGRGRTFI